MAIDLSNLKNKYQQLITGATSRLSSGVRSALNTPINVSVPKPVASVANFGQKTSNWLFNPNQFKEYQSILEGRRKAGLTGPALESSPTVPILQASAAKGLLPNRIQKYATTNRDINSMVVDKGPNFLKPVQKFGLVAGNTIENLAKGMVFGNPQELKTAYEAERKLAKGEKITQQERDAIKS